MSSWPVEKGNYILGKGFVALIVPGEKLPEIPKELLNHKLAIAGAVITPNLGIEKIIKNVVTNPNIQYVVIAGKDITGFWPADALVNLWKNGIDDTGKILGARSSIARVNLSKELVEAFRKRKLLDLRNVELNKVFEIISKLKPLKIKMPSIDLKTIEKSESSKTLTQADFSIGHLVRAWNPKDAWYQVLREIWFYGNLVNTHFGYTKELLLLMTVIRNPSFEQLPEHLPYDLDYLERYLDTFLYAKNPGYEYTYGERIRGYEQVEKVIEALKRDPSTRQAVISVFWPTDHELRDKPCLSLVQFFIRANKLHIISYWRSHDMYGAAFANWYGLAALQSMVAEALNLRRGQLVTISSSAHIYQRDFDAVQQALKEHFGIQENGLVKAKKISGFGYHGKDPKGYYVILEDSDKIYVSKYENQTNRLIFTIEGNDEEAIRHTLARLDPSLYPESYLWLGKELGKLKKKEKLLS
jgi:thymidylate synthase